MSEEAQPVSLWTRLMIDTNLRCQYGSGLSRLFTLFPNFPQLDSLLEERIGFENATMILLRLGEITEPAEQGNYYRYYDDVSASRLIGCLISDNSEV